MPFIGCLQCAVAAHRSDCGGSGAALMGGLVLLLLHSLVGQRCAPDLEAIVRQPSRRMCADMFLDSAR